MKTWLQKLTFETSLFILAFLLGVSIRFVQLGQAALNDSEARLALQALDIVHGKDILLSPEPGQILLSSLLFFVFGATNFTARLWPAITGALLMIAAFLVRDQIGRKPALILAFLMALDPALVAVSRTGSSHAAAIASLILGFICLLRGSSGWAGLFLGLSLLGGPAVWPGMISLGVLAWLFRGKRSELGLADTPIDWRKFAFVGAAVFGLTGSLLMTVPSGLSAAAGSIVAYLQGWAASSQTSISLLVAAVPAYQLPALIFSLVGLAWGIRKKSLIDQIMGVWWALALVQALAYPARSVLDVAWASFPMLVLAARQASRMAKPQAEDRLPVLGQAAISVILLLFVIYTLVFSPVTAGPTIPTEPLIRIGMAIVLLFAITGMVAWGWSIQVAGTGLQWGATLLLVIFGLSAVFHAAGISRHPEAELIRSSAYVPSADLLALSLRETSQWRPDPTTPPKVTVVGFDSSALRWSLRDYPQTMFTGQSVGDVQPDIVISERTSTPDLAAEYRGQAMIWTEAPAWSLLAPYEWLRWLVYRDIPTEGIEHQQIIYWVKSDEFPGGNTQKAPASAPADPNKTGADPGVQ